jgi:hypothetical protein
MKRFSFGATLLLVGAAAMALAGMQGYKLKRTAKEGDVTKYKMSGELEVMGQTVGFSATMVNKTIKVESNGDYLVEGSQLDAKINLGGSEMDVPSGGATTTKFKPDGTVLEVKGEGVEMGGYRMANLMTMIVADKELKAGDTWTSETKGDSSKQTVDVKGTYTFDAIEKMDGDEVAKVSFELKETAGEAAATVKGTVWISTKDGNMIKTESTWKDVPVPGAPAPVSGKMSMTLVK